jgi:hypothetical protein
VVTNTIVIPRPFNRQSKVKNLSVEAESRLPAGTSARRILGSFQRARATVTNHRDTRS